MNKFRQQFALLSWLIILIVVSGLFGDYMQKLWECSDRMAGVLDGTLFGAAFTQWWIPAFEKARKS